MLDSLKTRVNSCFKKLEGFVSFFAMFSDVAKGGQEGHVPSPNLGNCFKFLQKYVIFADTPGKNCQHRWLAAPPTKMLAVLLEL